MNGAVSPPGRGGGRASAAAHNMSWGDPVTSVSSGSFGQSTDQANLLFGRRMQLGMRLEFQRRSLRASLHPGVLAVPF